MDKYKDQEVGLTLHDEQEARKVEGTQKWEHQCWMNLLDSTLQTSLTASGACDSLGFTFLVHHPIPCPQSTMWVQWKTPVGHLTKWWMTDTQQTILSLCRISYLSQSPGAMSHFILSIQWQLTRDPSMPEKASPSILTPETMNCAARVHVVSLILWVANGEIHLEARSRSSEYKQKGLPKEAQSCLFLP